jgi:PadR family transcriptional regulator PadR
MGMRTTKPLVEVAIVMMQDQGGTYWGYQLMKETGLRSGVLYPILDRMLADGWVVDGWEEQETARRKHMRRRYYELTDKGKRELGALLVRARSDARFRDLNVGWAQ